MQQGPLRAGREPEGESLQHLQKGMTASLYRSLRNTRTSSRLKVKSSFRVSDSYLTLLSFTIHTAALHRSQVCEL